MKGSLQHSIDVTNKTHLDCGVSEFEIEDLKSKLRYYERLFHELHYQYEFVLATLSTFIEDSKTFQLLPKSTKDRITQLVSSTNQKSRNVQQDKADHLSVTTHSIQPVDSVAGTNMANQITEMQQELGILRGAIQNCMRTIQLRWVV